MRCTQRTPPTSISAYTTTAPDARPTVSGCRSRRRSSGTATFPACSPASCTDIRVHGPWEPARGLRFNPAKLLIDPYAKAIAGRVDWAKPIYPYRFGGDNADLNIDRRDSASGMPKCVVVNPYFDWEHDRPPHTPLSDSIIYEMHVRGFSMLNEQIPKDLRGTYAGLASPPAMQLPEEAGHHRRRTDAGPPVRGRQGAGGPRTAQLLGLQHHELFQPRVALLHVRRRRRAGARNSRPW